MRSHQALAHELTDTDLQEENGHAADEYADEVGDEESTCSDTTFMVITGW